MVYEKVSSDMNFVDREKQVEKFWKDNDIFQKSIDNRKKGETYTFYDGPPTANGKPHIGHVLTRVIKDMIPRYRTMKGYMVPRKAGWDTHGLPVELELEKELGLDGKEQIEEYGLEPFIKKCKESVWKYKGMWEDFSSTVGFWADMDNPYITYDDNFIESEWWALKQIWDKGLLYKGFKIVPYCPRCGTPLSSHEVAQGYKAVKERSAVVRFKCVGEDAYFLAWTTTPWTLPSNVALCVNPEETYVKVKAADGYTYYMAEALLDKVLGGLAVKAGQTVNGTAVEEGTEVGSGAGVDYEVLETYKGKDLEYKEYEPLYQCAADVAAKQHKKGHFVTCDDYVTMSDGTGIVHIAPAFGEDDAKVGRKYDLPFVQFVDGKGELTKETPYAGLFVKKADPEVLKDLDKEGKLFDAPKFEHDYPYCWRCDTPLIYYARESWFIKMSDPEVKANLIANNKTINWIPETIGTGRFGAWLENVQDWGISRNRYWGTPLNIWVCDDCGEMLSIGSKAELKEQVQELNQSYDDSIGWIYIPDTNINYPIMQAEDNEYYLHRSYDGSYLYSGSIYLDWQCKSDFSGDVNMLYGHNMQNGSMFADVVNFINKDYFDSHKYGWLTTEDSVYRIEFFSVSQPQSYSGVYNVQRAGDMWLKKLKSFNVIDREIEIEDDDCMISLSTCTNSEGSSRTVLTGKLIEV